MKNQEKPYVFFLNKPIILVRQKYADFECFAGKSKKRIKTGRSKNHESGSKFLHKRNL